MAEIPASWGLTTSKRTDGKLDIVGKTDAGDSYRVRTTDGPSVTERDLSELHDADRETYANRETGVRQFVEKLTGPPEHKMSLQEMAHAAATFDESDWIAAAEPVVHAGLGRKGLTTGSTRKYRRGWELAFGKEN